jgi:hypothetical protein
MFIIVATSNKYQLMNEILGAKNFKLSLNVTGAKKSATISIMTFVVEVTNLKILLALQRNLFSVRAWIQRVQMVKSRSSH